MIKFDENSSWCRCCREGLVLFRALNFVLENNDLLANHAKLRDNTNFLTIVYISAVEERECVSFCSLGNQY